MLYEKGDSDQQLTKAEAKKLEQLNDLVKENDRNFSTYISHNTLPEGYKKESERISRFIMGSNQIFIFFLKKFYKR